jgi:hypothetical protein
VAQNLQETVDKWIHTLSNGLRVANFSSPHPFTFIDGTVIPAVDADKARNLMLEVDEKSIPQRSSKFKTVELDWSLSERVADEIDYWFTFFAMKKVDVVLVPLPVMTALKSIWNQKDILKSPFRVIRVADRITKSIHIDKFCI